jgi:epsilon-lactone hydrolase
MQVGTAEKDIDYVHAGGMSLRARLIILLLRITNRKSVYAKEFAAGRFDAKDVPAPPDSVALWAVVRKDSVAGRNVWRLSPQDGGARGTLLFVHGGGFVHNMSRQHWDLAVAIVRESGWSVVVPDYPLAPAATVDDALPFVQAAWSETVAAAGDSPVAMIGDSAGGCLAALLTQRLAETGARCPERLFLLSPWLDVSMSNPAIAPFATRDAMLQIDGLDKAAQAFAGQHALDSAGISPLHGDLEGLPPVSLFIGGDEMFLPDCALFRDKLRARSGRVDWHEYPGLFHVWVAMTALPEAQHAISAICADLGRLSTAAGAPTEG